MNNTLSFYNCRLSDGDAQGWWDGSGSKGGRRGGHGRIDFMFLGPPLTLPLDPLLWEHSNITCCNQIHLNFLHSEVVVH